MPVARVLALVTEPAGETKALPLQSGLIQTELLHRGWSYADSTKFHLDGAGLCPCNLLLLRERSCSDGTKFHLDGAGLCPCIQLLLGVRS